MFITGIFMEVTVTSMSNKSVAKLSFMSGLTKLSKLCTVKRKLFKAIGMSEPVASQYNARCPLYFKAAADIRPKDLRRVSNFVQ